MATISSFFLRNFYETAVGPLLPLIRQTLGSWVFCVCHFECYSVNSFKLKSEALKVIMQIKERTSDKHLKTPHEVIYKAIKCSYTNAAT